MQYQKINETTYRKSCGYLTTTIYISREIVFKHVKGNGKEYTYAVTENVIRRKVECNLTKETITDFRENILKNHPLQYFIDKFINKDNRNRLQN